MSIKQLSENIAMAKKLGRTDVEISHLENVRIKRMLELKMNISEILINY
jgi:hypothetical protein